MSQVFIWPSFILILLLAIMLYNLFLPCNSGLFIGGCQLAIVFLNSFLFISLIGYVFLVLSYSLFNKSRHTSGRKLMYPIFGIVSLVITGIVIAYAPLLLLYPLKLRGF